VRLAQVLAGPVLGVGAAGCVAAACCVGGVRFTRWARGLTRLVPLGVNPPRYVFDRPTSVFFVLNSRHKLRGCLAPGRDPVSGLCAACSRAATAMAPTTCDACGKSGCKLLRCGRCRNAWFCGRECQIIAATQGHSGANCRPIDGARTITAAEVAPCVPDAAGPSTTTVDSALMAPAANSCHACGKNDAKLLRCGRCRGVWFCNRECQDVARKELGHRGANCRPADGAQRPPSLANARSPFAAPSRPTKATDVASLCQRFSDLSTEGHQALMTNTRIGSLAAVETAKEAASVADLIGGAEGADRRSQADNLQCDCLLRLGNTAAAARAACSSLRTARAAGRRTLLVTSLATCATVANQAPGEMAKAERESRDMERLGGSPSYGGLDLSQEGWVSLPTNPAALSRLGLAYQEAAVTTCDAALTAAGGRDTLAAGDQRHVPSLRLEAQVRGRLGASLCELGERQRGVELLGQAVALMRLAVRKSAPGIDLLVAKRGLAGFLCNLAVMRNAFDGTAEAEACLREALALCEDADAVMLKQDILTGLVNMSGRPDQPVGPAEATALRSRLNALYAQAGRNHDTSCTICLETLEQSDGGADKDAADDGGRGADGYTNSAVFVLGCGHQFHRGCLSTWWRTAASRACPLCKK